MTALQSRFLQPDSYIAATTPTGYTYMVAQSYSDDSVRHTPYEYESGWGNLACRAV